MRLVVELTRDGHYQTILAQLYKSTALQTQYNGTSWPWSTTSHER